MAEHPKVFISYSHDSPGHKQWVLGLSEKLRDKGVNAILDQWDLNPGDDRTLFMEHGVKESDRVLVICTDRYVRKANDREGGVGYEQLIVTAQLARDLGTDKFIPIIRQASGEEKTPTFLETRVYIDFTDNSQFDERFNELLYELYGVPVVQKPPLGESLLAQLSSGQEASPSDGLDPQSSDIPEQVKSASNAYYTAVEMTRTGDEIGWRQLVKQIKPSAFNLLRQRRQKGMAGKLPKDKEPFQVVDEVVDVISPLISVALAGVESRKEQFRDQKSTFDDLLNIAGERDTGSTVWVNIPRALGYVYHSLHGGLSLNTNQLDLALSLVQVKIPDLYTTGYVRKRDELMGWVKALGGSCTEGWEYLSTAYDRWEWLAPIFGDESEYRASLVAYYMALNIHELAVIIASGRQDTLNAGSNPTSPFSFKVPLVFVSEGYDINEGATALLLRNQESLTELWTSLDVTRQQMEHSWRNWVSLYKDWLFNVYGFSFDTRVYHENLSKILQH